MTTNRPSTSQPSWLIDLICLFAILAVFYACWLGSYPVFTPDEGRYPEVAREMIASHDYITPRVNGVAFLDKPILYYWLQAAALKLFGVNEWAIRLFPALFGLLGCLLTYTAGRFLFCRRTGLLAAVILATTPLYFGGAHYANLDLEVAVLISGTLFFFISAAQSHGRTKHYFLLATYLFAALAFLTKGLIGIVFPAFIGGLWVLIMRRSDLFKSFHLTKGLLLFLVIVLPWYVLVQRANPEFLHFFFVTQQVSRFLSQAEFNNKTPVWFYAPIVLFGFFPWTIFLFQALYQHLRAVWRRRLDHPVTLFLLLWVGFIFTFFSIPHSKTIGYILPVFPALALLTSHYLISAFTPRSARFAAITFALLSLFISGLLLTAHDERGAMIPAAFSPYLYVIITLFMLSGITALFLTRKKSYLPLVITAASCSTLFLLTLTVGTSTLNTRSAKPLTTYLKTVLTPQDEVVHYFKYFHDVPLYLGQRVTIVADWQAPDIAKNDNWARELWYGMSFQPTGDWLINEGTFWTRWLSHKRLFVFLSDNYLSQFDAQLATQTGLPRGKGYTILGQHQGIMLISNYP